MSAPAIPPRIAQRAREVATGLPLGLRPADYAIRTRRIAAALLAQDREATERACAAVESAMILSPKEPPSWNKTLRSAIESGKAAIRAAAEKEDSND
jgi:hypothetical protein